MTHFSRLLALQQQIQDYIKTEWTENTRVWNWTSIVDDPDFGTDKRLDIYYQAYRLRLLDTLENDFPKLKTWLGQETFSTLAKEYISLFPSQHFSLKYFGKDFSHFLATKKLPDYYVEMAIFEWALTACLEAADAETVKFEKLKSESVENYRNLQISFHPAVQLQSFQWNVPEIWKKMDENQDESKANLCQATRHEKSQTWLLCRAGLFPAFRPVSEPEAKAFTLFQTDYTFDTVSKSLSQTLPESEVYPFLLNFIQQCSNENIITLFSF